MAAVLWEDSEAINQAKQLLANFLNKGQVIPANLKEVSYSRAQKHLRQSLKYCLIV